MKIKKGDTVQIITGKDKGKTGTVLQTFAADQQVLVDGINVKVRHQKNRRVRSQGQIVEAPAPIDVSNVALLVDKKPVRVGYVIEGEGKAAKKVRVARPSGAKI